VTVVADRGVSDCKLFDFLESELAFSYVSRLRGHIYLTSRTGERHRAAKWVGKGGRACTLRGASVTDSHCHRVETVVCVNANRCAVSFNVLISEGMPEPQLR